MLKELTKTNGTSAASLINITPLVSVLLQISMYVL